MSQLSGNSCNIITLLPLGVECESINASTPQTTNGLISLFVTGGTPPYSTTWSNGSQGAYLFNLSPGTYTATTTDYYKDFTATTTCTVGYDSFYLQKFQSCANSAQTVYYVANIPSTYVVNKVYRLQGNDGCWTNKGTTLWTGQTYINTSATTQAGPYNLCIGCSPTKPPDELKSALLCMRVTETPNKVDTPIITNIQLNSGSTINGKQSWTSSTEPIVVFYNSATTKWEITGWSFAGVPTQSNSLNSPLGTWTVYGSSVVTMLINNGICSATPTIKIQKNDTSCEKVSDGSVIISAGNGTPPYQYSLDNVIYGSSNTYVGLSFGNYTAYVRDSLNQIASESFTINSNSVPVEYTVNLVEQPISLGLSNNAGQYSQISHNIIIDIDPPLPSGKVITFDLLHTVNMTKKNVDAGKTIIEPTLSYSFTTGSTTGGLITGYTAPTISSTSYVSPDCSSSVVSTTAYTEIFKSVISGSSGSIIGVINKKITTPSSPIKNCTTYGQINDVLQITNLKLLNQNSCETLNKRIPPLKFDLQRSGKITIGVTEITKG